MITLRVDVYCVYPSKLNSFLYMALGFRVAEGYLRNYQTVARIVNESHQEVKAYWSFTRKTLPDRELPALLNETRHEVGLHIVNHPDGESNDLENLELTSKEIVYYTMHEPPKLFGKFIRNPWKNWEPRIRATFSLQFLHQFRKTQLDSLCHSPSYDLTVEKVENHVTKGGLVYFDPPWLFHQARMSHKEPSNEALRRILAVDIDLESMRIRRKFLLRVARDKREYERSVVPTAELLQKLKEIGTDLFSFVERKWCLKIQNPQESWVRSNENIALLKLSSYDEWWKEIGKKTRNMIRKAKKNGVKASVVEPNEKLAEGIWKIYNETPIRQERASQKYGTTLQQVTTSLHSLPSRTYVGAYFRHELAGFMELIHGDNLMIISQILSLKKHWDKAINNALIAKLVEVCLNDGVHWVMYGRMGDFSSLSLDNFKQNNGFRRFQLTRYHIPITKKGELAIKLRMHREMRDILPQSTRYHLAPIYYWLSRNRMRLVVYFKLARANNK